MVQADHHVEQHADRDGRSGDPCHPDRERRKERADDHSRIVVDADLCPVELSKAVTDLEGNEAENEIHLIVRLVVHIVFHALSPPAPLFSSFWEIFLNKTGPGARGGGTQKF